jgi:hypothetical protein
MATGVKRRPPAPKQKRPTSKPSFVDAPPHQMVAWKASVLILLAFCLVGAIPLGIVAYATGHRNLAWPSGFAIFSRSGTPTPTDAPDLALPRDAWVARSVDVLPHPSQGAALATLAPAFPVKLLQHQRVGGTIWSRIEWVGPINGTGGAGWVPDGALISYGKTGAILGDLGSLAPSLRQAVSPYAKQFSAIVYIPSQNRLYSQGSLTSVFALGTGIRPVLLSALYARAATSAQPVNLTDALALSHGDANATLAIYQRLGGVNSLSQYLSSHSIQGIQMAPTWTACHATPRAMVDFYAQLAGGLLQAKDRSAVISVLSLADAPTTTNLVAPWARAAGNLLVAGIAPTDSTWTVSVAGFLNPANGPQLIVLAVATSQSSTDAAMQAMRAFYTQLTTLFGG